MRWAIMTGCLCSLGCFSACGSDSDPEQYTLTITITPTGKGRVFSLDGAVDCQATCTYEIKKGTSLSLQPEAGVDHTFSGWDPSAACGQAGACEITMNDDLALSAIFSKADPGGELDPAGDFDEDGLTNGDEQNTHGTSPWLEDTDGDGYSDYAELVTYGFDATNDPFKFNPLVADIPKIKINLVSPPGIRLNMTSTVSGSSTVTAGSSRETSTSVSNTSSTTNTSSVENKISRKRLSIGTRWGDHFYPNIGPNTYTQTTTEENSFSWSETQSTENTQAYNESLAITQEQGFSYQGGRLSMLVKVENSGNIAYTLRNLVLSAVQVNAWGEEIAIPIGNLGFDSQIGVFPETTLGPGDVRDTLVFDKDDMALETTLALLKDSRGLLLSASTYELTDANGIAFNHALTAVRAKTALVILDYGPGTGRSPEYHMVATNIDFNAPGVTLNKIFTNHLRIPYTTQSGLVSVRDVVADASKRKDWSVIHLYKDAGEARTAFFNTEVAAYDFEAIRLRAGDVLHLIFRDDEDDDGLGRREEFTYATDPTLADTDQDTIKDGAEFYGYPVLNLTLNDATVRSDPKKANTDNDAVSDGGEVTAQTDPSSRFPVKSSSGKDAEAQDAVADQAGNLFVVGYGEDLPSASGKDWWLKKLDPMGVEVWDLRFDAGADGGGGGFGNGGIARAVALSPTGELYVVGYHSLPYNVATQEYWWVKKLSAWDGVEITEGWNKGFDRNQDGCSDSALDVALDAAGSVYVVGYGTKLAGPTSGRDWWIKKFSPAGVEDTTQWNKVYDSENSSDEATAVVTDSEGNVYVGGHGTNLAGASSGKDWRIVKYNSSGDTLWVSSLDGGHNLADVITGMALDTAGDLYVSGYGTNLAGASSGLDAVIRKFSGADGSPVVGWEKIIYGQGSGGDVAYDVIVSDEDMVYQVGQTTQLGSGWFVRKYTTAGTEDTAARGLKLPSAASSTISSAQAIAKAPGGTFYVVGSEGLNPSVTPASWWLTKFYDLTLPPEE